MKKYTAVFFVIFTLVQGTYCQTEKVLNDQTQEQLILMIDKTVLEIKNDKENYRKIISEIDSILNSKNEPNTITETAYKKGDDLKIVQYYEKVDNRLSDYYINDDEIIYIETKNSDNTYNKTYFNKGRTIVKYIDGKKVEISEEDMNELQETMLKATEKLINRYRNK